MIASSAFVLTALTMTGIYMKSSNVEQQDDGYTIDFTSFGDNLQDKMDEIEENGQELAQNDPVLGEEDYRALLDEQEEPLSGLAGMDSDLDYPPMEVGSGQIEIPGLTNRVQDKDPMMEDEPVSGKSPVTEDVPEPEEQPPVISPDAVVEPEPEEENEPADSGEAAAPTLHFSETDGLKRPVSGEVLIPYSMNSTVYFSTLDQFKCSPALVLAAEQGSAVTACAEGRVVDIFENEEIGQAVTMELGDGYKITYGQLEALNVTVGSHVEQGEVIGWIAKPTKYYCVEGSNLYLKLTSNGKAINPEALFR